MHHEGTHPIDVEPSQEDNERFGRYDFRHRVKTLLETLNGPKGSSLPNREKALKLLGECLSLVPPFSEREEEWLDHELAVERGDIVGAGPEDKEWVKRHPRFPQT
jgi:hypothetical protein